MIRSFDFSKDPLFPVTAYRLTNAKGEYVDILDYGAVVQKLVIKDSSGNPVDVVLGYEDPRLYNNTGTYFGAVIGRIANRVSRCSFSFEGRSFHLYNSGGGVSLHGGKVGFNNRRFRLIFSDSDSNCISLGLTSEDKDEGYPGKLDLTVTYTFTDTSSLIIDYSGTCNKRTVFSPTNHSYFNLSGQNSGRNILDTYLHLNAPYVTPLGPDFTPTGEIRPVDGTSFDFTGLKSIGEDIDKDDSQLLLAGGYDINYVIDAFGNGKLPDFMRNISLPVSLPVAGYAFSTDSGIGMVVQTDLPCVQFYSGNFLTPSEGKDGAVYGHRYGFCLETQSFPDAVNKKSFPSVSLFPGEEYRSTTAYSFGTVSRQ